MLTAMPLEQTVEEEALAGVNPDHKIKCSPDKLRLALCLQITMNIIIIITTCIQWLNMVTMLEE